MTFEEFKTYVKEERRKDKRSDEEFKKDIKEGNEIEVKIMQRFKEKVFKEKGVQLEIQENGCGMDGQYMNVEDVNCDADFKVNGVLVEVKFNREKCFEFHIKKAQLEKYIKNNVLILWVNGWNRFNPVFRIFSVDELIEISKRPNQVVEAWGGKIGKKIFADDYQWIDFK